VLGYFDFFIARVILRQTSKNSARENAYIRISIMPVFFCAVACDGIHFTAPIICVMIVKDFLGEDQNDDI